MTACSRCGLQANPRRDFRASTFIAQLDASHVVAPTPVRAAMVEPDHLLGGDSFVAQQRDRPTT